MQPILKIDLTTGEISQLEIPPTWVAEYLGGASLAARFLHEHLNPDLDPLSPQAPLLFMNGPLSGTAGPCTGRTVVCARSPATRLWGESNIGGFWGTELRMAGYDGLWVQGRAAEPVYLWIQDGNVELRPAGSIWGQDTYQTQTAIEKELQVGKVRVATIGIAGEARIPFAAILCDHGRAAGRTGMGAIMGAKNLKAIAVQGHGEIPVADPGAYNPLRSAANQAVSQDGFSQMLRELGTSGSAEYFDYLCLMPKRYFQNGHLGNEICLSGSTIKETILVGRSACHACVIACGRVVRLEDGEKRKGPEYETLVGFGPNLGLNDPVFVTRMGELCDRYGLDVISMSNILGLVFRLFELEKITPLDTGGIELHWGNFNGVEELIHLTAHRQGFGAYLAEGSRSLSRRFGAEDEAVQVNGLEVPYHDPRGASGMALVYATSPRGACHNQSDYFLVEIGQVETSIGMQSFDRLAGPEKAANVAIHQNWITLRNSLVMCTFANMGPEGILDLINAACGFHWKVEDMLRCGERGWNLKRVINQHLGLTRANEILPKAFHQPYADNPPELAGFVPDLDAMLEAYYTARGWDTTTGHPTKDKLSELGLDWTRK